MTFLKSAFSRLAHKPTPVVSINMALECWYPQLRTQPTQLVQRVEICTALATGQDAWGSPVGHHHSLLRVILAPAPGASGEVLLIERVLSTGGAYHSVTPIEETLSTGGTLFHPDVHDRICVISSGPSAKLAQHVVAERTLKFGDGSSPQLTLAQLAQILNFVSRTTTLICAGGDCQFQSRSFVFTCMAALTPTLPPAKLLPKPDGGARPEEVMDDTVFELSAEIFLAQVPWLVRDHASVQALALIGALKDQPRERAKTRLVH